MEIHADNWQRSVQNDSPLSDKFPIEWVHVPKTGSSFLKTLVLIPGVCQNVPEDIGEGYFNTASLMTVVLEEQWKCNTSRLDTSLARLQHGGIDFKPGFEAGKGRFMTMMRQPEQRLISQISYEVAYGFVGLKDMPFAEHAKLKSGCVTKILTGSFATGTCSHERNLTTADVETAKIRLSTGFSFIGMTEQWDLSICLFNTMFKLRCRSEQFQNSRPTFGNNMTLYDTALLNGYRDPYDTELFAIGTKIFQANLKKYNVSESSCESCWREAGLL